MRCICLKQHLRIEQEIYKAFNYYYKILQIQRPIRLNFSSNMNFGGKYQHNKVTLNRPIIDNWEQERKVCEFLIAHELVHAKYNDSNIFSGFTSFFCPPISVKLAFRELRANTIAFDITNCNELDLTNYFSNFYFYSRATYFGTSGGYLDGNANIEFIQEHKSWTHKTVKAATSYFKHYSLMYRFVPKYFYNKFEQQFLHKQ